jgi:hypothetical protein
VWFFVAASWAASAGIPLDSTVQTEIGPKPKKYFQFDINCREMVNIALFAVQAFAMIFVLGTKN